MDNGERFAFGENWKRFLELVDHDRIVQATASVQHLVGLPSFSGKTFLDIGCGSGLFSLAATRLGAASVRSFDYDRESVACAQELKRRFNPNAQSWTIEQGSILDEKFVVGLGVYDIVYSWGVLHHTGAMWQAIAHAGRAVGPQGLLVIALYNDQGFRSHLWHLTKKTYNRLPSMMRPAFAGLFFPPLWGPTILKDTFKGRPLHTLRTYASARGMSPWRDLVDWVGGLPFEVATPQAVIDFCRPRGLELIREVPVQGFGCNEFVFRRVQTV